MRKYPSFFSIISIFIIIALGAWPELANAMEASANPLFIWFGKQRVPILFALLILAFAAELYKIYRADISCKTLKSYLDKVHQRYFKDANGKPSPHVRISILVPGLFRQKTYRLLTRSGQKHQRSKLTWDITKSLEGKYDGVVGYVRATGTMFNEEDLPQFDTAKARAKKQYLLKTHLTDKKVLKLNMKARSMIALAIQDHEGNYRGILTVESENQKLLSHNSLYANQQISNQFSLRDFNDILENIQCMFG